MRTNMTWGRSILALAATFIVAGPGLVLAGGPIGNYTPKIIQILGPGTVAPAGSADYDAKVTFTDNSVSTFTGAEVGLSFSAVYGTISNGGAYTNTSGTRDAIGAQYTYNGVTVSGRRIIRIQ